MNAHKNEALVQPVRDAEEISSRAQETSYQQMDVKIMVELYMGNDFRGKSSRRVHNSLYQQIILERWTTEKCLGAILSWGDEKYSNAIRMLITCLVVYLTPFWRTRSRPILKGIENSVVQNLSRFSLKWHLTHGSLCCSQEGLPELLGVPDSWLSNKHREHEIWSTYLRESWPEHEFLQ